MRVYIDIGHGGKDPGAVSGNFIEHKMNLVVGTACADELKRNMYVVKVEAGNLTIGDSALQANGFQADLLLSIHHNAGGGDRGEVIYAWKPGSEKLANVVAGGLKVAGQTVNRVYKSKSTDSGRAEYFGILRVSRMPAVIVESCFIDNVVDRQLENTIDKQKYIGKCIANAIVKTYGTGLREDTTYNDAINVLTKYKIISSPDYWLTSIKNNAFVRGDWMGILLN